MPSSDEIPTKLPTITWTKYSSQIQLLLYEARFSHILQPKYLNRLSAEADENLAISLSLKRFAIMYNNPTLPIKHNFLFWKIMVFKKYIIYINNIKFITCHFN